MFLVRGKQGGEMFHKTFTPTKQQQPTSYFNTYLMAGVAFTFSFGMSFRLTKRTILKYLDVESDVIRRGRWERAVRGQF